MFVSLFCALRRVAGDVKNGVRLELIVALLFFTIILPLHIIELIFRHAMASRVFCFVFLLHGLDWSLERLYYSWLRLMWFTLPCLMQLVS